MISDEVDVRPSHWFYTAPLRLRSLFHSRAVERDLDDEVRFHLEKQIEQYVARGMAPDEARRAARRQFGGVEQKKEECRDMRHVQLVDELIHDVRYALRTFAKAPGFTAVFLLTLALGIGANVAVFALVNGLLLKPLPYAAPDRLVTIQETFAGDRANGAPVSRDNFLDWQARQRSFSAIGIYDVTNVVLAGTGEAERVPAARASAGAFRALGVAPFAGRTFADDEDRPAAAAVAVISHRLWHRRFSGQPIIGRAIVIDDAPRTVVGIMPPTFSFPDAVDVWLPVAVNAAEYPRGRRSFDCLGRLKPGATVASATNDMQGIARQLEKEDPANNQGASVMLSPLRGNLVPAQASLGFTLLLGTVGFVLLIACANLANLTLSRAAARAPEMAMRAALGASRGRLLRQSLTESGLLAGTGAALGLLAGRFGRDALVALVPVELPPWLAFEIDGRVAVFALLLAGVTTALVGLVPALRLSRPAIAPRLSAAGARVTRSRDWLRASLIASEVALATVLLVGSGLMMRALSAVLAVDPGLRAENLWSGRLARPPARYDAPEKQRAFYTDVLDRVRALPGVRRASAVSALPMSGAASFLQISAIEGRPPASANEQFLALLCVVMPDYFETTGIQLRRGRTFEDRDGLPGTLPVAIVSDTFVRRYLPPGDPLGRRVKLGGPWLTIVGVVADVHHMGLGEEVDAGLFVPYNQQPKASMSLVVRAGVPPLTLTEPIRRAVRSIDRNRPLFAVRTLQEAMARSIWQSRLFTWLFGVFGAVALTLAGIGVYGVISYSVVQRTRELGLRLALGARQGQIHWLVMRHGIGLSGAGLAVGLAGSVLVGRLLRAWLHGVSAIDPTTYAAVPLVLAAAALAACYLPARRATRIDPMTTLRE